MADNLENQLYQELFRKIDFHRTDPRLLESRRFFHNQLTKLLKKKKLSAAIKKTLIDSILNRLFGWGPLQPFISNPVITEIMVNGPQKIFIEKEGKIHTTSVTFYNDQDLLSTINHIVSAVGRRIDESSPLVDARLPDGSRVNAIIPPLSLSGPILTIRKFSPTPFTLDRLIKLETISSELSEKLQQAILTKKNILISGGTGSGKTSTLNALSRIIPSSERLVTIEDSAELRLQHSNLVSLESRPPNIENRGEITIQTLLKNALRMRPDRIIIGEVRGDESFDMLQAMNTGHPGSITTIHANAPLEALLRLESMIISAKSKLPLRAVREQIFRAIDVVIQQSRFPDGSRKITHLYSVAKEMGDPYNLKEEYVYSS